MFAMFFGAGNVVFPLAVGRLVEGGVIAAMGGLILTAILIPFGGLISMSLYNGDYLAFFRRVGRVPGMCLLLLIIGLIGPFGGIPRCITLTYSTLKLYVPMLSLMWFAIGAVVLTFLCCFRKNRVIDLLGYVLTPLLLIFLGIILIKGLFFSPHPLHHGPLKGADFMVGLKEGYNTMDLLAAFFFSSIICQSMQSRLNAKNKGHRLLITSFKASIIGAVFLAIVYVGFAFLAASHSHLLADVGGDQLLGKIGAVILGPMAGFVVSMAVAMACLTTAIGLTTVTSEFLQKHVFKDRVNYLGCVALTLIITGLISLLGFSGIVTLIAPILSICYPGFLVLCAYNLIRKTILITQN